MPDLVALSFAIASTLVASVGMLFFKLASRTETRKMFLTPQFISGGILFVLGTFLFVAALRLDELSNLFPVTALTYIWVMLVSRKWLGEPINKYKAAAVLLIVAGIVLATV